MFDDALKKIEEDDDHDLTGFIYWDIHKMHTYNNKELTEFLISFMAAINLECDDESKQWIMEEYSDWF